MTLELNRGGTLFGGALLVAGTAIGGGMLALPVLTAVGGFFPSIAVYVLCWLFMTSTALLLMEVFLWSKEETNIASMAKMTLGMPGKVVAWILYLFLFYSLTVAYVSGGGGLVGDVFEAFGKINLPPWIGPLVFIVVFAPFVIIGPKAVDRVNALLMLGLIISFLLFVFLGVAHIELHLLTRSNWLLSFLAAPVVFTSFAFQGIVPTLTNYLDRDYKKVKRAIVIGSTIPLVVYILWEALILGVIPLRGLEEARIAGLSAVAPLKEYLAFRWLFRIGEFFAFFALITSFLGVTLGLLDFLADGLKVKKTFRGKLLLSLLIFVPPLIFSIVNPFVFLNALYYAGGLGCALLLGLLPILMAWRGRYHLNYKSSYSLPGGRVLLTLLILFVVLELVLMVVNVV